MTSLCAVAQSSNLSLIWNSLDLVGTTHLFLESFPLWKTFIQDCCRNDMQKRRLMQMIQLKTILQSGVWWQDSSLAKETSEMHPTLDPSPHGLSILPSMPRDNESPCIRVWNCSLTTDSMQSERHSEALLPSCWMWTPGHHSPHGAPDSTFSFNSDRLGAGNQPSLNSIPLPHINYPIVRSLSIKTGSTVPVLLLLKNLITQA